MLISTIITVYNEEQYIARCVESVLPGGEVIIVDGGSTDGTAKILSEYPVKIIHDDLHGATHAANLGIQEATGEAIALLTPDDWRLPGSFHDVRVALQSAMWCYGDCLLHRIKENGEHGFCHWRIEEWGLDVLKDHCILAAGSVVVRKEVFQDVGLFDERLPAASDYEMWLRIATAGYVPVYIDRIQYVRFLRKGLEVQGTLDGTLFMALQLIHSKYKDAL